MMVAMNFNFSSTVRVLLAGAALISAGATVGATVDFQAVYFDPRETPVPEIHIRSGSSQVPIEIDKNYLTGPHKAAVRDGRFVDFFERADQEQPSATLTLPVADGAEFLFVFVPEGESFRVLPIAMPSQGFGGGATLIINATASEVGIRQGGGEIAMIGQGRHRIIPAPGESEDGMVPVQLFERPEGQDHWEIAQSTRWAVDPRFRSIVFFHRTGPRLMIHGIQQRTDGAAAAEAE
jgi:hypothetical protein